MSRLWIAALVALGLSTLLDVALGKSLPGFTSALGLFGCILIIIGSKWLGQLLQRREGYYEVADEPTHDSSAAGEND